MSSGLQTLKDLEHLTPHDCDTSAEELRAEAVKWVKHIDKNWVKPNKRAITFIEVFFNLTEEDLTEKKLEVPQALVEEDTD